MSILDDLSIQLYSARFMGELEAQFDLLAAIGYRKVEPYGALFSDVPRLERNLARHGMTAPTAHVGLELWRADPRRTAQICRDLGIEVAFVPAPPQGERDKDAEGWRTLGRELAALGKVAASEGLRFGWHNHAWEYGKADDGRTFLDLIFAEAPDILFEFDVAWAVRGGGDPIAEISRHKGRLVACHVKDLAPPGECLDEDGWADPGHGVMGWKDLSARLRRAGVRYFVAEHDKPNDVARFARRAREAAASWG
ncbi:sugar phosphate isomerase/epimerase [Alsobacter sp. SYSU M60028]|uniref:Sugar phosphate isomerase/epimerase n=1 Tax=Alsobacter ponti TaxID=2962936 RepID=A0ABT1LEA3_9HYPH|nr:sugar phosphate isomerase/epimerase [Alsobacter ponti]MCP8938553.1 sugar phosphate isomerase/epimerase [Alsobacter ponti]